MVKDVVIARNWKTLVNLFGYIIKLNVVMLSKKNLFQLLLLITTLSCSTSGKLDSSLPLVEQDGVVWVAAHRANTGEGIYPENSLGAINACIEHGVDIIEIDVRESEDGEMVIIHDNTLDRTTNGKGKVSDFSYEALKKLNLMHQGQVTSYRIPTLEEVLALAKGKIRIDLDVKLTDITSYKRIADAVYKHGMADEVFLFLYDTNEISRVKALVGDIQIMPRARTVEDIRYITQFPFVKIIHIDESFYRDSVMANLINHDIRVWTNALGHYDEEEKNGKDGFNKLFAKTPYVNVIQTDYPVRLIRYLKINKLRD